MRFHLSVPVRRAARCGKAILFAIGLGAALAACGGGLNDDPSDSRPVSPNLSTTLL